MVTRIKRKKKPPKPVINLQVKAKIVKHRRRIVTTGVLTWTYPTQRTDGTVISILDALTATIFDSFTPGPGIGTTPPASPGSPGTFTTGPLAPGIHNFTILVKDFEGNSSTVSNTATLVVSSTLAPPDAVINLAVMAGP